MFGSIGFIEFVLIFIIALIVIGPKQLPEMARSLGKLINEFRRATGGISKEFFEFRDATNQIIQETKEEVEKKVKLGIEDPLNDVVTSTRSELDSLSQSLHNKNEKISNDEKLSNDEIPPSTTPHAEVSAAENNEAAPLGEPEFPEPELKPFDPFGEAPPSHPESMVAVERPPQSDRENVPSRPPPPSGPPGSHSRGTSPSRPPVTPPPAVDRTKVSHKGETE